MPLSAKLEGGGELKWGGRTHVIAIATRGCSVGKGSDELASQHESGDVGKAPHHNHCVSFSGSGRASAD